MNAKQRLTIARAAQLLRDTYQSQGLSPASAREKTMRAFADALDRTRLPRSRTARALELVDDVGVVAIALYGAGIKSPDPIAQETIIEVARRAIAERGGRP